MPAARDPVDTFQSGGVSKSVHRANRPRPHIDKIKAVPSLFDDEQVPRIADNDPFRRRQTTNQNPLLAIRH